MPALPITIGELTDVPTFDSPIASPWAQEVTRRIAHRFGSIAERNAKYPAATAGPGALCAVNLNALYMSDGVGWIVILEPARWIAGVPAATARWAGDSALPLIFPGATLPSSALVDAAFQRCGQLCHIEVHVNTGAAGGFSGPNINIPFAPLAITNLLSHGPFHVSYTSPSAVAIPGFAYVSGTNLYSTATLQAPAGGGVVGIAATPVLPPFPPAANSHINLNGSYLTAPSYWP